MYKIINSFYATTYDSPNFINSNAVSQAFYWERVLVLKQEGNWSFILQSDNYKSWINNFYLVDDLNIDIECEFIILKNKFLKIIQTKGQHKNIVNYLSYGTRIPLFNSENYSKDPMMNLFYIASEAVNYEIVNNKFNQETKIKFNKVLRKKILSAAYKMLGSSYIWGGKTAFGFDCSGFIQTIYNCEVGILLPRDSGDQFNYVEKIEKNEVQLADLVFFKDKTKIVHVGIYVGDDKIIHCSGRVKVDSINNKHLDYNKVFDGLEIFYAKL